MGTHAVSRVVRRVTLSLAALLAVSELQVLAAAPAAAHADCRTVVVHPEVGSSHEQISGIEAQTPHRV